MSIPPTSYWDTHISQQSYEIADALRLAIKNDDNPGDYMDIAKVRRLKGLNINIDELLQVCRSSNNDDLCYLISCLLISPPSRYKWKWEKFVVQDISATLINYNIDLKYNESIEDVWDCMDDYIDTELPLLDVPDNIRKPMTWADALTARISGDIDGWMYVIWIPDDDAVPGITNIYLDLTTFCEWAARNATNLYMLIEYSVPNHYVNWQISQIMHRWQDWDNIVITNHDGFINLIQSTCEPKTDPNQILEDVMDTAKKEQIEEDAKEFAKQLKQDALGDHPKDMYEVPIDKMKDKKAPKIEGPPKKEVIKEAVEEAIQEIDEKEEKQQKKDEIKEAIKEEIQEAVKEDIKEEIIDEIKEEVAQSPVIIAQNPKERTEIKQAIKENAKQKKVEKDAIAAAILKKDGGDIIQRKLGGSVQAPKKQKAKPVTFLSVERKRQQPKPFKRQRWTKLKDKETSDNLRNSAILPDDKNFQTWVATSKAKAQGNIKGIQSLAVEDQALMG